LISILELVAIRSRVARLFAIVANYLLERRLRCESKGILGHYEGQQL
jgi:hypothetical protein